LAEPGQGQSGGLFLPGEGPEHCEGAACKAEPGQGQSGGLFPPGEGPEHCEGAACKAEPGREQSGGLFPPSPPRLALGISYRGAAYQGWQSQTSGQTVQDHLQRALSTFAAAPVTVHCAGRTDSGVHAVQQVVHLDPPVERDGFSWLRGTNRYLPSDIAVQWAVAVGRDFHARNSALGRHYRYLLLQSAARPSIESGAVGWVFRPLDEAAMRRAADLLIGEHDFSAFRSSECQSPTPIKTLRRIAVSRRGALWRFDFEANAFLHHMVRNLMGCLVAVGSGRRPAEWVAEVLASRDRDRAAPTFPPDGLYFVGPDYDPRHGIPTHNPAMDWLG
jgi:tRNA pseudouridine38-40 synthase